MLTYREATSEDARANADNDPIWGTLPDNLHVRRDLKGQDIDSALVKLAAEWAYEQSPDTEFYLWVLAQNMNAQNFYDKISGINQEKASLENPDGSFPDCYRYVWPDIKTFL